MKGMLKKLGIVLVLFGGITTTINANASTKKKMSVRIVKLHKEAKGTIGEIYNNYSPSRVVVDNLVEHPNKIFKVDGKYIVKYKNGKTKTFLKIKRGKIKGFISIKDVKIGNFKSDSKTSQSNNSSSNKDDNNSSSSKSNNNEQASSNSNNSSSSSNGNNTSSSSENLDNFFSTSEIEQIKQYRAKAKSIGNITSDNQTYISKPQKQAPFNVGQLQPGFIQNMVDWINFYRSFYNLSNVSSDDGWNQDAQYGAADLYAADQGLSHGLVGFTKPDYVSDDAWQKGIKATRQSNLEYAGYTSESESGANSFNAISTYINDQGNDVPGHRDWLLSPYISKVGIGQAGYYNDVKVFDTNSYPTSKIDYTFKFPNEGIFPVEISNTSDGAKWEVAFTNNQNLADKLRSVSVYDNTIGVNVPVSNMSYYQSGFGYFTDSIAYQPDNNYIKANHSYTITINLDGMSPITYTTKLFSINFNS